MRLAVLVRTAIASTRAPDSPCSANSSRPAFRGACYAAQISASVGTVRWVMTLPMRETFIRCL